MVNKLRIRRMITNISSLNKPPTRTSLRESSKTHRPVERRTSSKISSIFQPVSVRGWTWSYSSMSTGFVVSLRGDWAIFRHGGSGRVGRVWSNAEKSLEILRHGWTLNPGHRQWDSFILPLCYHDPGHGEDSEIYSFSHRAIITDSNTHNKLEKVPWHTDTPSHRT